MAARIGAMHVARNKRVYVTKSGEEKTYESVLLRRTYRADGKVKHETLANLKPLPEDAVTAVEATLRGERLVPAGAEFSICRSLPHGHVAAVSAMAHQLGLPALLGPPCRARDLVAALIISRVVRPASKRSTVRWWPDGTLGADLDVADASTDEIYAAMALDRACRDGRRPAAIRADVRPRRSRMRFAMCRRRIRPCRVA